MSVAATAMGILHVAVLHVGALPAGRGVAAQVVGEEGVSTGPWVHATGGLHSAKHAG